MFRQTLTRPNARNLALRDPARAALVGAISRSADFGNDFGDDYAGDESFAGDPSFADDVAAEIAAEFGDDVGEAVAAAIAAKAPPTRALARRAAPNPQAMAAWNRMQAVARRSAVRGTLLDPNKGSTVKVECYELPMSEAIVIGTAQTFTALSTTPQTEFKPKRLVCNAPQPGFAFLNDIKAANVSASVSNFVTDAFNYNANSIGTGLSLPKLMPQTTVSITGQYTGAVPPGVLAGTPSFFTATLYGPSTLAGG